MFARFLWCHLVLQQNTFLLWKNTAPLCFVWHGGICHCVHKFHSNDFPLAPDFVVKICCGEVSENCQVKCCSARCGQFWKTCDCGLNIIVVKVCTVCKRKQKRNWTENLSAPGWCVWAIIRARVPRLITERADTTGDHSGSGWLLRNSCEESLGFYFLCL